MDATEAHPRKWDPVVRFTHWAIVAAMLLNALVTEEGSNPHVWVGYGLAAILALRLLWGLIGPREARFSAFPPSPARAIAHIRDIAGGRRTEHTSHNPLGALMVYAIWGALGVIIASGIAMAGIPDSNAAEPAHRPAAAADVSRQEQQDAGEEREERDDEAEEGEEGPFGEVHEAAVNLLYVLILLHLAGVLFEARRSGRHIVMAMLPGRR